MPRRPASNKEDVTVKLIAVFKRLISEGTLAPGGRLPAERELAASFGVSRNSLRQALKVLEIMGVISQRVGDGTYLNSGAEAILGEPMEFLILLDGISVHELMEARLIVEPELAAQAASRATAEDVAEIERELSAMEDAGEDSDRLVEHDLLFHQAIFRAAGNRVCSLMFSVVHRSMKRLITLTSQVVSPEHTLTLHRRILAAIRKRNPDDARRRMSEHLLDARKLINRAAGQMDQEKIQRRIAKYAANGSTKAGHTGL
ncbi:MAG: FadR family transcriptional regulator [Bryobacterales bacterium]|nr:FadR family transcriptional regulator [Bryobacterales bacterium]